MKIQNAYTFTNEETNLIQFALLNLIWGWSDQDGEPKPGKEKDYEKALNLYRSM